MRQIFFRIRLLLAILLVLIVLYVAGGMAVYAEDDQISLSRLQKNMKPDFLFEML